ncbi:hypothetical protein DPMN_070306 [Dreissena polymorpha]|uniref:Uncharacterized protein n=1 Tax=Dreissena polymorpha TaxID=45954 RepID=A0A9D3Z537_DREPO|nr:hypothetical protein DPMN_070306 [Dreissena polymorpha]
MRQNCRIPSNSESSSLFSPTNHLDLADDSECGLDQQDRGRLVIQKQSTGPRFAWCAGDSLKVTGLFRM